MRHLVPVLSGLILAACAAAPESAAPAAQIAPVTPAVAPRVAPLGEPAVEIVGARPPFTYWAPAGSRIEPHPTNPGIWIAKGPGRSQIYYFGDDCGASRFQQFVGKTLADLPPRPDGAEWRFIDGEHTEDLRHNRLNIYHEPGSTVITAVACH